MYLYNNLIKKSIINYGKNIKDTGNILVQISILTIKIKIYKKHFIKHKKDLHSKRGLLFKISLRKKLLKYLKKKKNLYYYFLIKKLGLRH